MQMDQTHDLPLQPPPVQRAKLQVSSLRNQGAFPGHYTGSMGSACCQCFGDDSDEDYLGGAGIC